MLDCQTGITTSDENFFKILKKEKKKIIIVANKADNNDITISSSEFYKFGKKINYISLNNEIGINELLNEIIKNFKKKKIKKKIKIPKISILGKPNAGKSSLLNIIIKEKRSIVEKNPGTTRDPIKSYYNLYNKKFIFTDTAGIRKKSKIKNSIEFYSIIKTIKVLKNSDICIIMIDIIKGITAQDINIISLTNKYKKGAIIAINKCDLVEINNNIIKEHEEKIKKKILPIDYIPIIFISVIKKKNIYKIIKKSITIYKNKIKKISTYQLNNKIITNIKKYPHPSIQGKNIKIKFITQLSVNTPTFLLFSNFPKYIKETYKRYIKKQIRKNFNWEGIPISLVFKKKN